MKQFQGIVISTKMQKTAVVEVRSWWTHPLYKKRVLKTKKYLVHDSAEKAKVGDTIIFKQSRPISKRKNFILVEIVKK